MSPAPRHRRASRDGVVPPDTAGPRMVMMMAMMRDVAKLAGVSTATVSHALNKTRFVEPETSARVRLAVVDVATPRAMPHHDRSRPYRSKMKGTEAMANERYTGPGTSLRDLARARPGRRHRASSWDRTGGNDDRLHIAPGSAATLLDVPGAGIITHIWVTTSCEEPDHLRKVVLRMWWDGEAEPSVEVPLGDFFGMGHARTRPFSSAAFAMSAEDGKAFNCFFAMPFARGARVTATSECAEHEVLFYYYVDYEEHDRLDDDLLRFHAQWRRQNPCDGLSPEQAAEITNDEYQFGGRNIGGADNYVILEAAGRGHYVGCNLNVTSLRATEQWNWYGEGDDMIWIDQDRGDWPPRLHGTGTEDYFNTSWCPTQVVSTPYHGIPLPGGPNWSGQISLYRLHLEDPILFERNIRVTIEHGHDNRRSDDYSSTAYWYQTEPHAPFPTLPQMHERLPIIAPGDGA